MVSLASPAVVEDRLAAVLVADSLEAGDDLAIAVSQSTSSWLPSGLRRIGEVRRCRPFW